MFFYVITFYWPAAKRRPVPPEFFKKEIKKKAAVKGGADAASLESLMTMEMLDDDCSVTGHRSQLVACQRTEREREMEESLISGA